MSAITINGELKSTIDGFRKRIGGMSRSFVVRRIVAAFFRNEAAVLDWEDAINGPRLPFTVAAPASSAAPPEVAAPPAAPRRSRKKPAPPLAIAQG